ncbi:hypothetical protein ScPMuIL_013911 [Solemya velum]
MTNTHPNIERKKKIQLQTSSQPNDRAFSQSRDSNPPRFRVPFAVKHFIRTPLASGCCSHIIGLLIDLQHWLFMGFSTVPDELSRTNLPQKWTIPRGNKIEPDAIPNICMVKPHPNRKQKPVENIVTDCRKIKVEEFDSQHLHSLKALPISYTVSNPRKKSTTHLSVVGIGSGLSTHASFYEPKRPLHVGADCGDLKLH